MAHPDEDAVLNLFNRIKAILEEYDHAEWFIAVRTSSADFVTDEKLQGYSRLKIAIALLNEYEENIDRAVGEDGF